MCTLFVRHTIVESSCAGVMTVGRRLLETAILKVIVSYIVKSNRTDVMTVGRHLLKRATLTRAPTGVWANLATTGDGYPPSRDFQNYDLARIKKALESSC